MAKAKKYTTHLVDKEVQLQASLTDISGDAHPRAGQTVTIIERTGETSYTAETDDGSLLVIHDGDWVNYDPDQVFPLDAELAADFAREKEAINLYTDPQLNQVQQLLPATVKESPFNPRSNYPEDEMAALTESAKAVGIIQPVLVRDLGDGSYELVFGHRRLRAALSARLPFIPAIVRVLTDAESAQLQAVENLQRKDLDVFDEAQSFAAYIKAHHCTKDDFCRRTGLSRTQVYNRLKLATLHEAGQLALRSGKIQSEVATLIARVPSEKHQAHALKLILDLSPSKADGPQDELMTVRKARGIIREKFTLGLKDALWALDDATLLAEGNGKVLDADYAVACNVCPKRSGVDPVLYVDLFGQEQYSHHPSGENVCTDPACFDAKKTAQLKRNQAALEAKGKTVIAGGKARQAISAQGEIKNGYIALKDVKEAIKKATVKGKPAPEIVTMTIQDPRNGKTVEVVKLDDVKAAGVKVDAAKPKNDWQGNQAKERAARELREAKAEADTSFYSQLFVAVRDAAAKLPRTTLDLQLIAARLWEGIGWEEKQIICVAYGCDHPHKLADKIGSMLPDELGRLMLDCVLTEGIQQNEYRPQEPEALLKAARQYGVDVAAMRKAQGSAPKPAKSKGKKAAPVERDAGEEELDYPS